jgi:SAM-dependent methyltransferase
MPGPAATRAAQNPAIQLHTGDLATAPYQDGTFDFVSMVHVIEHLPKPLATLRKVSALLKPGGTLFIAYPNVSSWQARWAKASWFHLDPPRHLSLVPPKTLTSILNKHGLSELRSSHLNLEQNLYGWTQSLLNMLHGQKNLFYNTLKHRDWSKQPFTFALDAAITVAALPLAIATDIAAAFAKKGATVELLYRKN